MEAVILVMRSEWDGVLSRLDTLEIWAKVAKSADENEAKKVLTTEEAAAYLRMHPESLLRARREKRIAGVKVNERDWGFRKSELDRYLKRHERV